MGMLWNVAVALDLPALDESWAQTLMSTKSVRSDEYLDPQ
jgi:hypothetical protein